MDTQPNEPTNKNSWKTQKLLSQRIKRRYNKTFGIIVIKAHVSLQQITFPNKNIWESYQKVLKTNNYI